MEKIKSKSTNEIQFQGNDFLPSETMHNKDLVDNPTSEERADRGLRKLRKSQKDTNIVNSGS